MQIKRKKEPSKLDIAIDNLLEELNEYPGYDDDYAKRVKMLEKLHKLKKTDRPHNAVNSDTLLTVGGNVLIALILIGFEQKHVITTKAPAFFSKLR